MKDFNDYKFSLSACEKEFQKFEKLLDKNKVLDEQKHILPFFEKNKNLCLLIGWLNPTMMKSNKLAHEYHLWGDFRCDLAIADGKLHKFCFVEFEDYHPTSIFRKVGQKASKEYAPRFERGFSQIVDWFCKIDGYRNTTEIKKKFGKEEISYIGVLIIGRSQDLDDNLQQRLRWRQENVTITSQKIHYLTFDDLRTFFRDKMDDIRDLRNS